MCHCLSFPAHKIPEGSQCIACTQSTKQRAAVSSSFASICDMSLIVCLKKQKITFKKWEMKRHLLFPAPHKMHVIITEFTIKIINNSNYI